jgi:hypothetical protein
MGNLDKIVIFNRSFGIVVKGHQYKQEPEVVEIALKQFTEEAKASIANWYEAAKTNPEMVELNYCPEDELNITSIEVYDIH